MKKVFAICFSLMSLFSLAQTPLTCNATLVGTTNPTAPGLCNGSATISLAACSNPPYIIQWINSDPSVPCQTLPPAEASYTGTTYSVNTLCGCGTNYNIFIQNSIGEPYVLNVSISNPAPTGISELSTENYISINPNPANDILIVDLKLLNAFDSKIEIANALGQIVLFSEVQGDKSQTFNIQPLPNGVYFVKVYNSNKQIGFKRIVVQK